MNESKYTCETCGKTFATASGRKYHAVNKGHKFANYIPSKGRNHNTTPEVLALRNKINALKSKNLSAKEIATKLDIPVWKVYQSNPRSRSKTHGTPAGFTNGAGPAQSKSEGTESGRNEDALIAYIFGRTQAQIESYAQSVGLPTATVTSRLGILLSKSSHR